MDVIQTILKEKKTYEQSSADTRQEIREIYDAYLGRMDNVKKLPYKNQETIPKLRTEVSYIVPYIFSGEPELSVEPIGEEDKVISQILEKIVNYRLSTIPNSYDKIEDWVKQGTTFGTSVLNVVWRTKIEYSPVEEVEGEEPPVEGKVVKDAPDFEVPNILDVYYNPVISDIDDQPSMLFRSMLPIEYVRDCEMYDATDEDGNLNREKVESKKPANDNFNSTSQSTDVANAFEHQEGMVEIIERVTKDKIQTIALGQNLLLRETENRYNEICSVKFIFEKNTIPNRFNGFGVGQNTKGLGNLIYKMFNQSLDSVALSNNPMFIFKKGSVGDVSKLVGKPGGGIPVDAENIRDAIIPILFPDLKQGAISLQANLEDEHKRASGASDLVQGASSSKTLGQDQIAQNSSSNRFELIQRRFRKGLAKIGEIIIKMELKNLQSPEAEILRIFPLEMRQTIYQLLINEAQDVKYNIKVRGETVVARNKDMEAKRMVELFNLSQNFLTDTEKRKMVRRIAERVGEQNIDEIIAEEAPMPEQMPGEMPDQSMMGPIGANETPQAVNQNI
jgi:hypothetical protein